MLRSISYLVFRKTNLILLVFFILLFLLNGFFVYKNISTKSENQVKVVGVIDGDTVVLENKTRLRLRHIDAPELGNCGGNEAKNLLTALVNNKKIIIKEQIPDQNGRAMAFIYIDKTFVNLEMLKSGLARYHSDKTTQTKLLKQIAQEAKKNKLGIYSSKCYQTQNLENPKCFIKGNLENQRKSGRKLYYLPNCAQYKFVIVEKDLGEQWFCDEKEAINAGYVKAETCN